MLAFIFDLMSFSMTAPTSYGWFHILSLGITFFTTFFLCHSIKNPTEKTVRRILFIVSLVVILFEIYKQFNFSFSYNEGKIIFDYQWYAFPFQFCSTPMYVGLLASLIKNERIHNSLCAYLATFSLFAGTAVMFYPSTVFIETIGINIQTMICHGSMITVGIYLFYTGYVPLKHNTILKALPVFAVNVGLAVIMNEIAHATGLLEQETFNMFFVSPYCEPHLPVYSLVQGVVPFPLCLVIYILGFTAAAYLVLLIAMGAAALGRKVGRVAPVN